MPRLPRTHRRTTGVIAGLTAMLAGLVGVAVLPATSASAASTLASLAEAKGRYFGSATDNPELTDSAYVAILTGGALEVGGEFDQMTPGNSMKWDTIESTQGTFSYTKGDSVVALAQAHNMKVRGHNLVWHSQRDADHQRHGGDREERQLQRDAGGERHHHVRFPRHRHPLDADPHLHLPVSTAP